MSQIERPPVSSSRWVSATTWVQDIATCLALIGLPLFHTTWVHDVFLAKTGLALAIGGVLGMAWFLGMVVQRRLRLPSPFLCPASLTFLSLSGGSIALVADNPARGLEILLFQVTGFVLFFSVLDRDRTLAKTLILLRTVAWTSLVIASIGLLEQSGIYLVPTNSLRVPLPVATIGNSNFLAHYLDLTIPVTASLLFIRGERSGWKGLLTVMALATTCCVMVLTQCRGGWVSVGLVALVFAVLKLRSMQWVRFLPVVLLSAVLISPLAELLSGATRSGDSGSRSGALELQIQRTWARALTALDESDPSRSLRIVIWENTLDMIASRPLGVGTGNYEFNLPAYRSMSQQRTLEQFKGTLDLAAYHAHNEYLEYLSETGIVGLLAMVAIFIGILWRGCRYLYGREWTDRSAAVAGCLGAVAAALVHALFSFNLQDPVSGTHFWVLAGILVSLTAEGDPRQLNISLAGRVRQVAAVLMGIAIGAASISCGVRILIADSFYLVGIQRFNEGKGMEAIEAMRQATEWRDSDFRHHQMLGAHTSFVGSVVGADSELGRRMHSEAESALRRSIDLHPYNAQATRALGSTLLAVRRADEAVQFLKRAVKLNPLEASNYGLLADAYLQTGAHGRALEARKQALSFQPHDTDLMLRLATDYRLSGDLDSAAGVLERAAILRPRDGQITGNLGSVYLDLGELTESERMLRVAIEVDPEQPGWRFNLVRNLIQQQQLYRAAEELETALRMFPQNELLGSLARQLRAGGSGN